MTRGKRWSRINLNDWISVETEVVKEIRQMIHRLQSMFQSGISLIPSKWKVVSAINWRLNLGEWSQFHRVSRREEFGWSKQVMEIHLWINNAPHVGNSFRWSESGNHHSECDKKSKNNFSIHLHHPTKEYHLDEKSNQEVAKVKNKQWWTEAMLLSYFDEDKNRLVSTRYVLVKINQLLDSMESFRVTHPIDLF